MQSFSMRFWPTDNGLHERTRCLPPTWYTRFLPLVPFLLAFLFLLHLAPPAFAQDAGSTETEMFGKGVVLTVVVHDPSGEPISSAAFVKVSRGGTIPAGQAQTSRGQAELVVNRIGEFTVVVEAAGYPKTEKQLFLNASGRLQVDVYLPRNTSGDAPTLGRPLLAPRARKALEQASQALSDDKLSEADKHLNEAKRLAPGNPDVLYVEGVLLLKQRRWSKAQEVLEKATQLDPAHAQAFAALGMALCDQGKYDVAIAPLEKSVQLNSSSAWDARWALAKAYDQQAHYQGALQMSQAALAASNGKAPQIQLLVAQSLTAVGRYEDAAQVLRSFLQEHADRQEAETARKWLDRLASSGKISSR